MKIEQLENISELTSIEEEINSIVLILNSMFSNDYLCNKRKDNHIRLLINKYIEQGKDDNIYFIIKNHDILKYRTFDEQMGLIEKYIETGKDEKIYDIINRFDILKNRTYEEQLELIDKYIELKEDNYVYYLIIDGNILANRTNNQQLGLIDKYIELGKDNNVYNAIRKQDILENKTYEEQLDILVDIKKNSASNIIDKLNKAIYILTILENNDEKNFNKTKVYIDKPTKK